MYNYLLNGVIVEYDVDTRITYSAISSVVVVQLVIFWQIYTALKEAEENERIYGRKNYLKDE
jgi:hypothetical protein